MKVLEPIVKGQGKPVLLLSSLNTTKYGQDPSRGKYRSHVEFVTQNKKESEKNKK